MQKSAVIYGFGRMGLTHYSILNHLSDDIDVTFIDPNRKLKFFGAKNIEAKIKTSDSNINFGFDYAFICTPPNHHVNIIEKCLARSDKRIFCEKPFGGVEDDFSSVIENKDKIRIGYVLRFNPIIQWLKNNLNPKDVVKVKGNYISNTLEKKPAGWRNGSYSGVLNEMGSHILDVLVYLFGFKDSVIIQKKIQSKLSDVDDIVDVELESGHINYELHFNWVNKMYRKPIFNFVFELKDGKKLAVDQQKADLYDWDDKLINSVSVVDISVQVPFYLRGVDFTGQMTDFINGQKVLATVPEALETRKIIKKILT